MRLAIVDDHELVRDGLVSLIASDPTNNIHVVYAGADPHEVLARQPDVVLLDIELGPGRPTVIETLPRLIEVGAHVLLISAYDEAPNIRRALRVGALGFIPKRVSYAELIEALRTVARGELHMSVDLASILANAPEAPGLSPRELDALRLYASGLKLASVAHRMGISPHTAKEYLDRVRAKYESVGRVARTRTQLTTEAQRDGFLTTVR
jgi:two-component system, NarL family, nitrate/nitrite response regulator NarL